MTRSVDRRPVKVGQHTVQTYSCGDAEEVGGETDAETLELLGGDVELLAGLAQHQGAIRAVDRGHLEAGGGQLRREEVAEEGAVVDQQQALAPPL
ncbi:MAG: hypothetical protein HC783_11880, partial [Rhodobacteraceae bacterium]|nr:hypothetical protein [Paracoccaceae bacterium]